MQPNSHVVRWVIGISALALAVCGCSTPSINAVYSDDQSDVTIDDRLVGLWVPSDPKQKQKDRYRVFSRDEAAKKDAGGKRIEEEQEQKWYRMVVESAGGGASRSSEFELRLVRLGATDFVDVYPVESERKSMGERFGLTALPVHVIMPIAFNEDRATVRPLDPGKVKALLTEAPKMTPHVIKDDMAILTGTVRQVQEFMRKVSGGSGEDVFGEPIELVRAPNDGQAALEGAKKDEAEPKTGGRGRPGGRGGAGGR